MTQAKISEEEIELGLLALRNAYWRKFSDLVQGYVDAVGYSEHKDLQQMQMGDMSSVYGTDAITPEKPNIALFLVGRELKTVDTIKEALEHPKATTLYIDSVLVATKRKDGWHFES